DRRGANVLHPDTVLGPADAVDDRAGPIPSGVRRERLADVVEILLGNAAGSFHHFRRVAGVVPFQHLVNTARVLQRLVGTSVAVVIGFVLPATTIVVTLLGVETGEQTVEILGIPKVLTKNTRGIGVVDDVLVELQPVGEDVVDDAAEEHDVGADPQWHVTVRERTGPGEPRVDVNHPGATLLRFHHPLETHRVGLGHVRALDDDAVGVGQILLEGGRAPATEAGPQTGDRGGVSNAGLVLDLD